MIKKLWKLSNQDQTKLGSYLSQCFYQKDEILSLFEEVEEYYEGELAPYLIGEVSGEIIGFLLLQEVVETTAYASIYTHSKEFLIEVKKELKDLGVLEVILESSFELDKLEDLEFEDAEYKMSLSYQKTLELLHEKGGSLKASKLSLESATRKEKEFYVHLLETEFEMDTKEAIDRFEMLLTEKEMFPFLVQKEDKCIGICACYVGTTFITLFDLAIKRPNRGKGLGTKMLLSLLEKMVSIDNTNRKFLLQVTHSNHIALHLYKKAGFVIQEQLITYQWRIG